MTRILLIILLFPFFGFSQSSDFIVVKKKGKTIRSYYAGTQIEMRTKAGAYRDAQISAIRNDSIFLQEFVIRQIPTTIGTVIYDTASSYRFAYHYNDIAAFGPPQQKGFNIRGSGASLVGGGILLLLGSGVVYLADRDKFSPELAGAAAVLAGVGLLLNKAGSSGMEVGKKKITLHYIDMTP